MIKAHVGVHDQYQCYGGVDGACTSDWRAVNALEKAKVDDAERKFGEES